MGGEGGVYKNMHNFQTHSWMYHSKLVVQRYWFDGEIARKNISPKWIPMVCLDPNGSQWFDSRKLAWVVLCNHEFLLDVVPPLSKRPRIETTEAMLGADNGNWWRWEWPLKTWICHSGFKWDFLQKSVKGSISVTTKLPDQIALFLSSFFSGKLLGSWFWPWEVLVPFSPRCRPWLRSQSGSKSVLLNRSYATGWP